MPNEGQECASDLSQLSMEELSEMAESRSELDPVRNAAINEFVLRMIEQDRAELPS